MEISERKALVKQLKRGKRGWTMVLPGEAGTFLGKRIGVEVRTSLIEGAEPPLTDQEVGLLEAIFADLPKLAARAEKAFDEAGAEGMLDEEDRFARPHIWIDRELQAGKSAGRWTLVVEVQNSDFAWHIEFVGTKFKEIWAGD